MFSQGMLFQDAFVSIKLAERGMSNLYNKNEKEKSDVKEIFNLCPGTHRMRKKKTT